MSIEGNLGSNKFERQKTEQLTAEEIKVGLSKGLYVLEGTQLKKILRVASDPHGDGARVIIENGDPRLLEDGDTLEVVS